MACGRTDVSEFPVLEDHKVKAAAQALKLLDEREIEVFDDINVCLWCCVILGRRMNDC